MPLPQRLEDRELAILGALAETLIPTDETPGADPAWARAFVLAQLQRHAEEHAHYQALANHVDALARADHGRGFEQVPVPAREALLRAHHPTLQDEPGLEVGERSLRRTMRNLMAGFLTADTLDIQDDPFCLRPEAPRRDRASPSTPEYAITDTIPDLAIERRMATNSGRGAYARVWLAAGYPTPPGLPQTLEDVVRAPDFVKLRVKP